MPTKAELNKMTGEQLDAEIQKLNSQRDKIKDEIMDIASIRDAKYAEEQAAARVAAMTETERESLREALNRS